MPTRCWRNCRLYDPGKLPKDSAQAPQRQGVTAESGPPGLLVSKLELLPRCQPHSWETAASRGRGRNERPQLGAPEVFPGLGSALSPCPPRSLPPRGPRPSSGPCGGVRSPERPAPVETRRRQHLRGPSSRGPGRGEGMAGEGEGAGAFPKTESAGPASPGSAGPEAGVWADPVRAGLPGAGSRQLGPRQGRAEAGLTCRSAGAPPRGPWAPRPRRATPASGLPQLRPCRRRRWKPRGAGRPLAAAASRSAAPPQPARALRRRPARFKPAARGAPPPHPEAPAPKGASLPAAAAASGAARRAPRARRAAGRGRRAAAALQAGSLLPWALPPWARSTRSTRPNGARRTRVRRRRAL